MSTAIYDAIVAEVEKGTFTPDALKRMQGAIDRVKLLEDELTTAKQNNAVKESELRKWEQKESSLAARDAAIVSRSQALDERAKALGDAERRVAVAEAVSATRKEVFDTIFKNPVVRRQVYGSMPVGVPSGGYHQTLPTSETVETITE